MKILCTLFLALIGSGLLFYNPSLPKEDVLSDRLIVNTGKKLGKKYNMKITDIGGGSDDGIWLISVGFARYGEPPVTVDEGRRMIVDCIEEYLKDVNSDKEIRPYVKNYPFKPKNLDIAILNYTADYKSIEDPYLCCILFVQGKILYLTKGANQRYGYKSEISETYDEALAILKQEEAITESTH